MVHDVAQYALLSVFSATMSPDSDKPKASLSLVREQVRHTRVFC